MISFNGLATGIDSEKVIQGLLEVQQRQMDRLAARKQQAEQRRAAFQALSAQVLSLRAQAGRLAGGQNSPFLSRSAQVSDERSLVATAASGAATGTYSLRVNALAAAHQVASQGYADREAAIPAGQITLRSGDRPAATIQIGSSQQTLQGLADAINAADAGVSAAIIQEGSGATPFRLLLTATAAGAANAISFSGEFATPQGNETTPAFDFSEPVTAAADASVTLGSGPGAVTVLQASNEIKGLIDGVTLNLQQADPTRTLTVRVQADTSAGTDAVKGFVAAYNSIVDGIKQLTGYDPKTNAAGLLLGDRSVLEIQQALRSAVLDVVPGLPPQANRLTAIGVSLNDSGQLVLDESRLSEVLSGRGSGVTPEDIRRLFALDATSSHPGVSFVLGGTRTVDRSAAYEVDVTQAAERAAISGSLALPAITTINGANESLRLTIDGVGIEVGLTHGDYAPQQLADRLEAAVNAHPDLRGRRIAAGLTPTGELVLTSLSYGSSSQVTVNSGALAATLGFVPGQSDAGVDVAGRFIVDGVVESATGRGRLLAGDAGNAHTADLQVRVTLAPTQVGGASEAELTLTRGVGARLDKVLATLLDGVSGEFTTTTKRYDATINSLQRSMDRQQASFDLQKASLERQFQAMEAAVSQLQSSASLLSSQLASLNNLRVSS